jgi:hypothetical protein
MDCSIQGFKLPSTLDRIQQLLLVTAAYGCAREETPAMIHVSPRVARDRRRQMLEVTFGGLNIVEAMIYAITHGLIELRHGPDISIPESHIQIRASVRQSLQSRPIDDDQRRDLIAAIDHYPTQVESLWRGPRPGLEVLALLRQANLVGSSVTYPYLLLVSVATQLDQITWSDVPVRCREPDTKAAKPRRTLRSSRQGGSGRHLWVRGIDTAGPYSFSVTRDKPSVMC